MSLGFSEIIRSIESEIQYSYVGDAIEWSDRNFGNAWSNAIDRFDRALARAIEHQDFRCAELEGEYYKKTVLDLLANFKAYREISEATSFLESLREQGAR